MTRLPPLDPEMRSAIARRLLFCRAYRQRQAAAHRRHNEQPELLQRLKDQHRLVQDQFLRLRRARAIVRLIEDETGYCMWIEPWWGCVLQDAVPDDLPSFADALGIEEFV